jgi:D-xylose 1-dehydrogenase (NADP+, D-xylono-1,5-lactone-forming)
VSVPVGWGVIPTTSMVAQKAVLPALAASSEARLVAVASRSAPGQTFGAKRSYHRYDSLLEDPDVEVVYLALPNHLHAEWTARAAAAGKHVLCEKPLACSAEEATAMAAACADAGVLLGEAYMTPFHPRSAMLDELLRSGRLGRLQSAHAAFTFVLDRPGDHRWYPDHGGGALLDLGVYVVAPLLVASGRAPHHVAAAARMTETEVDIWCGGWLDFGDGFSAAFECSFEAPERQILEVVGTEAAMRVTNSFTPGPLDTGIELCRRDGTTETLRAEGGDCYRGMVDHFSAAVRDGTELKRTPADAITVLTVLDRVRDAMLDRVTDGAGRP